MSTRSGLQTSLTKTSFERRRPDKVRTSRSSGVRSRRPGVERPGQRRAQRRFVEGRRREARRWSGARGWPPRTRDRVRGAVFAGRPAADAAASRRPARARRGTHRAGRRSSAASAPSKACAAGPDRLPGAALPVRRGCAATRWPGRAQLLISYQAKPASARRRSASSYIAAARSSSWLQPSPLAPASRAVGHGQVVAGEPGDSLRIGVVQRQRVQREVVRLEGERGVERAVPGLDRRAGHVVQEVEADRGDAGGARVAARPSATSSGEWRRPSARSSAASRLCAPIDSRVTPASRSARASPRSSGPGLASSVTSASGASPNRSRTIAIRRAIAAAGRRLGVPPPRYTESSARSRRRAGSAPARVERVGAQRQLLLERGDERADPVRRARARRGPRRRRSRSTGSARRRTERGGRGRPEAPPPSPPGSPVAGAAPVDGAPALGRSPPSLDVLDLRAARRRLRRRARSSGTPRPA